MVYSQPRCYAECVTNMKNQSSQSIPSEPLLVRHADAVAGEPIGDGVLTRRVIPQCAESPLALDRVDVPAGVRCRLPCPSTHHQLLVYTLGGSGVLAGADGTQELRAGTAALHPRDECYTAVVAGVDGLALAVVALGPECDEHAPLGAGEPVAHLDLSDGVGAATGSRSFQVLLGPENGSYRATLFVGVVPPGAAPWHFHQYDEIVYVLRGEGIYHQAGSRQPTQPGSAVRIPPRIVHINENTTTRDMHVLGVFTPAGSPAAAFMAADPTQTGNGYDGQRSALDSEVASGHQTVA
jgi:quercetin dioxygenase-like cupin family protein